MRDIKFRAFRIGSKEWKYGYLFVDDKFTQIWEEKDGPVIVDPDTIGQYTGLKDKNDKEIYEGDIVRTFRRVGRGFREMGLEIVHFSIITARWYPLNIVVTEKTEVLGNIYENPELLKNEREI